MVIKPIDDIQIDYYSSNFIRKYMFIDVNI